MNARTPIDLHRANVSRWDVLRGMLAVVRVCCTCVRRGRKCHDMSPLLAKSHRTSVRLAEVAFLLILIAGPWLVAAELMGSRSGKR